MFRNSNYLLISAFLASFLFHFPQTGHAQSSLQSHIENAPDFKEIPYFLRKLKETDLEDKRLEYNKKIHDAVVSANLSDKKVIKQMEPIIDEILIAMDSGLDRPILSVNSTWLNSAIEYFSREKGRKVVTISTATWVTSQVVSENKIRLSPYPDKILVHEKFNNKTYTLVEKDNIHEAIITSDGSLAAFFRRRSGGAEIWTVKLKNQKLKKIADLPSCHTILFSADGRKIFFQEKPTQDNPESRVGWVSASGGKPRYLTEGILLQSLIGEGPYKGNIVVLKKTIHHWGVAEYACPYAVSPRGQEIGRIQNASCQ